jgi:hypothetical protein
VTSRGFTVSVSKTRTVLISSSIGAARYGPPSDVSMEQDLENDKNERAALKKQFRDLVTKSMAIRSPELLPRELSNNLELIFSLRGYEGAGVISEIVQEAKEQGPVQFQRTVKTVETILSFAEDFVNQATQLDNQNKKLLGKIMLAMTRKDQKGLDKEELLDQVLETEKNNFTPGFLRHLDGECNRIASAPKVTPESTRLLEIIRIIQTRVLEEIGKDMGEAAVVLGQLMGYDDEDELAGVLGAGLTVRGRGFALEMLDLTQEALEGFKQVRDGVDPGLVRRVTLIDERLNDFLNDGSLTP